MPRNFYTPYEYYSPLRRHRVSEAPPPESFGEEQPEVAPPHSTKPFLIGDIVHNSAFGGNLFEGLGNIFNNIAIDDIILIAVIILFLTDNNDRDNALLIALGFLLINGFGDK